MVVTRVIRWQDEDGKWHQKYGVRALMAQPYGPNLELPEVVVTEGELVRRLVVRFNFYE